jgi:hypothetical protein
MTVDKNIRYWFGYDSITGKTIDIAKNTTEERQDGPTIKDNEHETERNE